MRHVQYTRKNKLWTNKWVRAGMGTAIAAVLIQSWSPGVWWKEGLVLVITGYVIYNLGGRFVAAAIMGYLILMRAGVLDILTGVLLTVIILLLSLIN
jgi:hypothetical protein